MQFEWDESKERINVEKHGLDFGTAAKVFADPWRIELFDETHSTLDESRYITIGEIGDAITVVMVVYTERIDALRLISARIATKREEDVYYGKKKY